MNKRNLLVALALIGFHAPAAVAQLSVTSTSIAHGQLNVPLTTAVSINFSAPLDTTGFTVFDPDTWPFVVELHPSDSVVTTLPPAFSNNNMTVTLALRLTPNTRFSGLVTAATGAGGEHLDRAIVRTWSTGTSLPSGSISGTIGFPGGDPDGTFINAYGGATLSEDDNAAFAVANSAGAYTVDFVSAGQYATIAVKDEDRDGSADPSMGEALGAYDPDQNSFADVFLVSDGEAKSGIDMVMARPALRTGNSFTSKIDPAALAFAADALLSGIFSGELTTGGEQYIWNYIYYSASLDQTFGFIVSSVICVAGLPFGDEGGDDSEDLPFGDLFLALPSTRIDTDAAIAVALANGGQEFLDENAEGGVEIALIGATVEPNGFLFGDDDESKRLMKPSSQRGLASTTKLPALTPFKVAQADTLPLWIFLFSAEEPQGSNPFSFFLIAGVHMETGAFVPIGPSLSLASVNKQLAIDSALARHADAALVAVSAPSSNFLLANVEPDGRALFWTFTFHSAAADSFFALTFSNQSIFDTGGGSPPNTPPSMQALPANFVDSDVAMAAAEANGGAALRQADPDIIPELGLSFNINPADPSTAYWVGLYGKFLAPPEQITPIFVNALTGNVPTAVEAIDGSIPAEFTLDPVFPNPASPGGQLRIPFSLARSASVELAVFNVLGQRVATLFQGKRPAGAFELTAGPLPASFAKGVYFVRMRVTESGSRSRLLTRRILLR